MQLHKVVQSLCIVSFLSIAFLAGALIFLFSSRAIDFSVLENYNPAQPSILLDDQGREWSRFQLDRRKFVSLDQMPESLRNAFLATEDHNFYQHYGISLRGIFRSMLVNLYHGKKVQGASTITQQLVRLLFFDAKKTFKRKVKEQIFAVLVELQFTKEQILETYLNHVYFGHGIYGVQAASWRFWNKNVQDLTIDESAVLAGLVQSPTHYSPILSPKSAQKRRNIVLRLMQKRGFIDELLCQYMQALPLQIQEPEVAIIAPHLKEMIRIFLEDYVGKHQLYCGGLIIQTTMNYDIQKAAEKAFTEQVAVLKEKLSPLVDGGMISIAPTTGEIKALVGGYNFTESKFNRATQAKRQMGSIFKPFVYATALEHGACFIDTMVDEPIEIKQGKSVWSPQNNTRKFIGEMTLARALSYSNNTITIKTLLGVGVDKVIDMARRVHISGDLQPYPSLALGCVDETVEHVAGSFNVWVNNGVYVQPHYIRWVKDKLGVKIYKAHTIKEQVMDSKISGQVLKVLTLGIQRLKKTVGEQWVGGDAAGKTGTTNDCRTCWFCGSTPELTTVICIGQDNNQPLGEKVYGARTSFPIWFNFSKLVTKRSQYFYYDPSLQEVTVDGKTGRLCYDKNNPERITLLIS